MNRIASVLLGLTLMLGTVKHIHSDTITVAYKHHGKTKHSKVSRILSACSPAVGDPVLFIKDYKVVACEVIR